MWSILVHAQLRWIVARDLKELELENYSKKRKIYKCGEKQKSPSKQQPVFKHCSLLVNCNRNLKTHPKNHLHGNSYLGLSEATNKTVLLNSALSSLKACCFCFLCSSIFLKPSIGMFLVVLFPSRSLSVPLKFYCCRLFVQSAHVAVSRQLGPKEKRDTSYQQSLQCLSLPSIPSRRRHKEALLAEFKRL